MGIYNCEIFNNLGLCCFYAQQYDMTLTCFERALHLATDESISDVWYNLGHIALVNIEDFILLLCFKSEINYFAIYEYWYIAYKINNYL